MTVDLRAQLQELAKVWVGAEAAVGGGGSNEEIPDGRYQMEILKAALKPNKAQTSCMVAWDFQVVAGEHQGRHYFDNQVISKKSIPHIKGRLVTLGQRVDKIQGLVDALAKAVGLKVNARINTQPARGEYPERRFLAVNSVVTSDDEAAEASLKGSVVDAAVTMKGAGKMAQEVPQAASAAPAAAAPVKRGPGRPPKPKPAPEPAPAEEAEPDEDAEFEDLFAGLAEA